MHCKDEQSGAKLKKGMGTKTPHLTNTVGVGSRSVGESQSLGRPEKAGLLWVYASRENYCANVNIIANGYGGIASLLDVNQRNLFILLLTVVCNSPLHATEIRDDGCSPFRHPKQCPDAVSIGNWGCIRKKYYFVIIGLLPVTSR